MKRIAAISIAMVLFFTLSISAQATSIRYTWFSPTDFDIFESFTNDGMAGVGYIENYRGNFVNQWGEFLSPTGPYDMSGKFSEGLAFVEKDGQAGYIDTSGAWVIPLPLGTNASDFHDGVAAIWNEYPGIPEADRIPRQVIDKAGNTTFFCASDMSFPRDFSCGLAVMQDMVSGRYGFVDKTGAWAITPQYLGALDFYAGRAIVKTPERKEGVIDESGRIIIPCIYDAIDTLEDDVGGCMFALKTTDQNGAILKGLADYNGNILIEPQSAWNFGGSGFSEDRIPLIYYTPQEEDGHMYFPHSIIDRTGLEVIPPIYAETAGAYNEGLLAVREFGSKQWKYVDVNGQVALTLPEKFSETSGFRDGLAIVTDADGQTYFIDHSGAVVLGPLPHDCSLFSQGVSWAYQNGLVSHDVPGYDPEERCGIFPDPRLEQKISSWAIDEISSAQDLGLVTESNQSYYCFRITRRRFAELAANLVEKVTGQAITPASKNRFNDTNDIWVLKAAALDIVNGVGDGSSFSPNGYITREQLAVMLNRTIRFIEEEMDTNVLTSGDLSSYIDASQISPWATQSVSELTVSGIMQGSSATTLSPKDPTTVEQAILLVLRAYQMY